MPRNFTEHPAPQRTDDWRRARLGILTGSVAGAMLATIQSGEAAKKRDLRTRLVVERLTSELQEEPFVNDAMRHGIETEALGLAAYEALTGTLVHRVGLLRHTEHMAGCSLDGYLGDYEGIVELKCPTSPTHIRYVRNGIMPPEHLPQVWHNLWVVGPSARFCDWISYDNRWPPGLELFVVRVERDDRAIALYEQKALAFLTDVDRECAEVEALWARRRSVASTLRETLQEVIAHG